MNKPGEQDASRGVYGISVAADLVGMGIQTLRLYERRGLLTPDRTDGGTRLYSRDDLDRLRRIGDLLDAGLNLAGIARVLDLEDANTRLEDENAQLRAEKEETQQWLKTVSIRPRTSRKATSPNNTARSARRR